MPVWRETAYYLLVVCQMTKETVKYFTGDYQAPADYLFGAAVIAGIMKVAPAVAEA